MHGKRLSDEPRDTNGVQVGVLANRQFQVCRRSTHLPKGTGPSIRETAKERKNLAASETTMRKTSISTTCCSTLELTANLSGVTLAWRRAAIVVVRRATHALAAEALFRETEKEKG